MKIGKAPKEKSAVASLAPAAGAPSSSIEERAKEPSFEEDPKANKKGIWEVSYESGVVVGYFEGTPKKVAAYLVSTDKEGKFIRKLNFLHIPVRKIPDSLMKDECCGKRFASSDRFCSRCGKSLKIDMKLPQKVRLAIDIPTREPAARQDRKGHK